MDVFHICTARSMTGSDPAGFVGPERSPFIFICSSSTVCSSCTLSLFGTSRIQIQHVMSAVANPDASARLQAAHAEYGKLQSQLQDIVDARQRLGSQLVENEAVQAVRLCNIFMAYACTDG